MPRSNNRGRNNNPSGRNQYSDWGVTELVRDRPIAAAAVAAGAAAAGLFLWSRRSQISDQISSLSDQIGEWTENMRSDWSSSGDDTGGLTTGESNSASSGSSGSSRSSRSNGRNSSSGRTTSSRTRGMSETGGGNSSLGAHSGGIGTSTNGSPSGRGRAQSTPTVQE